MVHAEISLSNLTRVVILVLGLWSHLARELGGCELVYRVTAPHREGSICFFVDFLKTYFAFVICQSRHEIHVLLLPSAPSHG